MFSLAIRMDDANFARFAAHFDGILAADKKRKEWIFSPCIFHVCGVVTSIVSVTSGSAVTNGAAHMQPLKR